MEREPASALKKLIAPAASGEIDVQHVKPNGDPSQVFTAPATELTTLNLLPGKTEAELAPLLEQLRVMLDKVTGQYGHSHWGPVVEIPGEFRNFVGWASVQVSLAFYLILSEMIYIRHAGTYRPDIYARLPGAIRKDTGNHRRCCEACSSYQALIILRISFFFSRLLILHGLC